MIPDPKFSKYLQISRRNLPPKPLIIVFLLLPQNVLCFVMKIGCMDGIQILCYIADSTHIQKIRKAS
jgi:hypothetical protein